MQAPLGTAETAAHFSSTAVVMCPISWLKLSGFPVEVQNAVEDLPFDGLKFFSESSDEHLHRN